MIKEDFIYLCYDYLGGFNSPHRTIVRVPLMNNISTLSGSDEVTFGHYDSDFPENVFDVLYGPARFINGVYDGICFIDEESLGLQCDKLVLIENIYASSWSLIGTTGSGTNEFYFFEWNM